MSRSIHTTHRSLARLRRKKFTTDEARKEAISTASAELRRKRRIKRQVAAERGGVLPAGVPIPADAIPIVVTDEGPQVFHALTPGDIRAILAELPGAAVEGITEIRLALDIARMAERPNAGATPDPHTGRLGHRIFPGVYTGTVLGTYFNQRGLVAVFAYVVDPAELTVPRPVAELFLRLQAMKTLLHELAHFHDHAARVARGRWLADRHENNEWYAEQMEHRWAAAAGIPYLEKHYARECRQFRAWMKQRCGIALPVGLFAGDTRRTERNGLRRFVRSTCSAFQDWIEKLPRSASLAEAALALVEELHHSEQYPECLALLDRVLAADPNHLRARACRAATLDHLKRHDEAAADARAVLAADPTEALAWQALAHGLEYDSDWPGLLDLVTRWAAVRGLKRPQRAEMLRHRAIALCGLGDLPAMDAALAAFCTAKGYKNLARWRHLTFQFAGRPAPAE